VSFDLLFPAENEAVKNYTAYLRGELEGRLVELDAIPPANKDRNKGISIFSSDFNGDPIDIRIEKESALWPAPESPLFITLLSYGATVFIRTDPIKVEEFSPIIGGRSADFSALAFLFEGVSLDWRPKQSKLYMEGKLKFDKALWHTDGKISSFQDIFGAQIIFVPSSSSNVELPERYGKFKNIAAETIEKGLEARLFQFEFAEGRAFWVPARKMQRTPYVGGDPAWSIIIPKDFESLQKLGDNIDAE
jgi:hypothetical protein